MNHIFEDSSLIDTRNFSEKVYEILTNKILSGDIRYGQIIDIKAIASSLQISTMPIRDAVRRLHYENIVEIKPRSNCLVKVPTKKSILDAFELREILEIHSISKICTKINESEMSNLEKIVDAMERVIDQNNNEETLLEYIKLDRLFHEEICNIANNEYIKKFYREVNLHLNMTFTYGIGVPPNTKRTYTDHLKIYSLLRNKSTKALEVLKNHLDNSRENIVNGKVFHSLE